MYKIATTVRSVHLFIAVYKFGNETLNGNCSVGQLTKIGFGQQMQNGIALYDAYVNSGFLNPNISSDQVYIRSDGALSKC